MVKTVVIGDHVLGCGNPCFIIAEAGVNHNGDLNMAKRLINVAVEAGADAVKFQTFAAERLVTSTAPKAEYQLQTTDAAESQYAMLKRLELSEQMHRELIAHCDEKKIAFLSTPFDEESADLLDAFNVSAFKIPSGEITNLPFLSHVARKNKPLIVSTGMSYLSEVETAVRTITATGNTQISLLHCVSNYPAASADINLRAMNTMTQAFGIPVGFSDHAVGIEVAFAAAALGAAVIEKHFTLDRSLPGPDHQASLEPDELKVLVRGIRNITSALGDGRKQPVPSEANTASVARKSVIARRAIPQGTTLSEADLGLLRPGTGLPPMILPYLIGRTTRIEIAQGTIITLEMLT
jgi:N-acetylneuraminate synthase